MNIKTMVVGFLFNPALDVVTLMVKDRPEWQVGRLNGIGGAMHEDEDGIEAMIREFREETGVVTVEEDWIHFANLNALAPDGWQVQCFCGAIEHIPMKQPRETEEPGRYQITHPVFWEHAMVNNLRWLIPMALDVLSNGAKAPLMVQVEYSR